MATTKITDLTAYTDPVSTDVLPIVDVTSDVTKKVSIADLMENAGSGSAAAPGISFDGDPNTGIYRPGADQVAISTNGTGRLFVNADGNVGINTSTFTSGAAGRQLLEINGSSSVLVNLDASGTRRAYWFADATETYFYNTQAGPLIFGTNDTERLRITSDGKLGLGTSSPGNKLAVIGTTGALADSSIRINGTAGTPSANSGLWITGNQTTSHYNWLIGSQYNVNGAFEITPSTAVDGATFSTPTAVFTQTGRVGIGTTSPGYALDVNGGIQSNNRLQYADGTITALVSSNGTGGVFGTTTNHPVIFFQNNGEAARFDTSKRLLVGTSTGRSGGYADPAQVQIEGLDYNAAAQSIIINSNDGNAPSLNFGKSRGTSLNSFTVVQSGDRLGVIDFAGADGTSLKRGAAIEALVDGTPGSNDMPGRLVFSTTADGASSPTERCRLDNGGRFTFQRGGFSGNPGYSHAGISINDGDSGSFYVTRDGAAPAYINRLTNDGTLVELAQANTVEGTISVSGTTVSYNGAHLSRWSQLPGGAERTEILRGTVLSNIDEMCSWGEEDNEQLNRMKVSDVEGDPNVAGVFQAWDDDDDTYTDDFYCAMTGDFIIRIAAGIPVHRGQLLMSAGDGTAIPQDDDIVRSKTVGKVTSNHITCTYDDGSYCVPCVLMAC